MSKIINLKLDDPRFYSQCLPSAICLAYLEKHHKLNLSKELHDIGKIARLVNSKCPEEKEKAVLKILEFQKELFKDIPEIDNTLENSLEILGLACKCNLIVWGLEGTYTKFISRWPKDGFQFEWPVLSLFQEIQKVKGEEHGHISVIQYVKTFFEQSGSYCFACGSSKVSYDLF